MLCQFSVKNYKSIRDEMTLSLEALSIVEHKESIIITDEEEQYLPLSVIYGPNGGGKSNVLEAIETLVSKVLRPVHAALGAKENIYSIEKTPVAPFQFSKETRNAPTEFELFFRTPMAEYRYILHIQAGVVIYERLDKKKFNVKRTTTMELFEREENNEIVVKGDLKKLKINSEMSDTLPLLSYLGMTYQNNSVIYDVFSWLENGITFLNYGNPLQELGVAIAEDRKVKKLIIDILKGMDIDIEDFRIEEKEKSVDIYMMHRVDNEVWEIDLEEESSGTKKIFGLLPFIIRSLYSGTALVVDELDAKIHPKLLKYIIELFSSKESNKKGAQLIFTSHDLSTMNAHTFRRDEIWFVAKGNEQDSKLYSLIEFKTKNGEIVRKDAKFDKQYLEGKYGADPYLRKIIDWGNVDA